jgi:hypothetical protein
MTTRGGSGVAMTMRNLRFGRGDNERKLRFGRMTTEIRDIRGVMVEKAIKERAE